MKYWGLVATLAFFILAHFEPLFYDEIGPLVFRTSGVTFLFIAGLFGVGDWYLDRTKLEPEPHIVDFSTRERYRHGIWRKG